MREWGERKKNESKLKSNERISCRWWSRALYMLDRFAANGEMNAESFYNIMLMQFHTTIHHFSFFTWLFVSFQFLYSCRRWPCTLAKSLLKTHGIRTDYRHQLLSHVYEQCRIIKRSGKLAPSILDTAQMWYHTRPLSSSLSASIPDSIYNIRILLKQSNDAPLSLKQ